MKTIQIETPEGYKVDTVEKVDNILIRFVKEVYEPKDGDVVFIPEYGHLAERILIYKKGDRFYAMLNLYNEFIYVGGMIDAIGITTNCRPATPEETQLLFDALEKEGKRWDAEDKKIVDIVKPFEIKKGDVFRCVKDVFMNGTEWEAYIRGRIYISETDGCITDERKDKGHDWLVCDYASKYFERLGNLNG